MIALHQGYAQILRRGDRSVAKDVILNRPVMMVTWHWAAADCAWAGGRLPTEAA